VNGLAYAKIRYLEELNDRAHFVVYIDGNKLKNDRKCRSLGHTLKKMTENHGAEREFIGGAGTEQRIT